MPSIFLSPEYTRLVTIIAHVDHGKTSLADNLIEHNNIISERLAGTLRYLDSDPEEQRRGITMRSSAIGIQHQYQSRGNKESQQHIIHLLDSPGHSDFSMEVSSSLMACDSCLLVIDVVEGMAPRTHQVLREAHAHKLVPILILNKIDRLATDLGLTAAEAYVRLRGLLETVNAAVSSMLTSAENTGIEGRSDQEETDAYKECWTFEPGRGNVVFASALFGWGFTVQSLARSLFRNKVLPFKPMYLKQYLFSDAKFRNDKILKWKVTDEDAPMFAEYGLQPLFSIYEAVALTKDAVGEKITADSPGMEGVPYALSVGPTGHEEMPTDIPALAELLSKVGANTDDAVLRAVLRRYRPLSFTVLDVVCEYAPSPRQAVDNFRRSILSMSASKHDNVASTMFQELQQSVFTCDSSPRTGTIAHVCKFLTSDRSHIRDKAYNPPEDGVLLGLVRVLSGRLQTNSEYYLLGPKHRADAETTKRKVRLYLPMGSSFIHVPEVPAGHLCAVSNLDGIPLKTMTLSSSANGMPLRGFTTRRPLVKVSVEPVHPDDTDILERGLVKLSLADSAVEVTSTARGERLLSCLGEIHLEQSILDLKRTYCAKEDIKLRVSDPIVDFGETTAWFNGENDFSAFFSQKKSSSLRQMEIPPYNEEEGIASAYNGRSRSALSGRSAALHVRVVPLSEHVFKVIQQTSGIGDMSIDGIADLIRLGKSLGLSAVDGGFDKERAALLVADALRAGLCAVNTNGNAMLLSPGMVSGCCVKGVVSADGKVYDPTGTAVADDIPKEVYDALQQAISTKLSATTSSHATSVDKEAFQIWENTMKGSAVAGFNMATRSGWICEEPVRNVLAIIEGVEIALSQVDNTDQHVPAQPLSGGMVVSALRIGIRSGLISRPARLMEGHLRLTLHASLSGIGSLYSVLSKRRGKVLDDSMVDGTDLLLITALIPQAEAFGLAPELLQKSSGQVTAPELIFSHWDMLDVDPFWIPTTQEEREDFGELQQAGDSSTGMDNTALKYIRRVRERKGLMVDSSRTVLAAEKQRTMKR